MEKTKSISVRYYAMLREEAGMSEETVQTAVHTATEFYRELQGRHRFSFVKDNLRVSINEEFKDWNTRIKDKDRIVFVPPVAGG